MKRLFSIVCILCVLCGQSLAAKTLKQRGFATQSYGVQNAGAPGDLGVVDLGSWTRRPFGPSLAGWTHGWSAHNANATSRFLWTIAGGSGEDTKGMLGTWMFFGPGTAGGNNKIYGPILFATGGEFQSLVLNVSTMQLDLISGTAQFADSNAIKTLPRHQWVWLAMAWENTGGNNWTLAALYKDPGGNISTLATKNFTMVGKVYTNAGVAMQSQDAALISVRVGLPSLYQIATVAADATYPPEIIEPAATPNAWYVSSAAAGTGDGTSLAQAWTPAQLLAETGILNFTVMSGQIVDPTNSNAAVDTTAIDADVLKSRYVAGTAVPNGDAIYFNDSAGPIRLTSGLVFTQSSAARLLPDPSLKRRVELRGTTRLNSGSWVNISGANYKQSISCKYPVVFEFDSAAEADSPTGKARWLAHPAGITTPAGFAAASVDGSFGTDGGGGTGTEVYLRATGSGNPASNGKVYEVTTGVSLASDGDLITFLGTHGLCKDLILRYTSGVNTNNTPGPTGRVPAMGGNGMVVIDNCDIHAAGRHAATIYETGLSLKQRNIIVNCTMNDCQPAVYNGGGGQTLIVQDNDTNGRDNHWYWEGNSCNTNAGVVGSTSGAVVVSESTVFEHGLVGGTHVFSKGWFINNRFPGACNLGTVTSTVVVRGNTLGFAGTTPVLGGTALTITRNRITGIGLPAIGEAGGTTNFNNNLVVATGAIGTTPSWLGTINFRGNTVDALATTGGATKALATRGGVVAINFSGNAVLFNNADLYRFFDTITPASGDSLSMITNQLQGTDVNRILVTAYAGATTKTLAQLVAGGQDSGSAWTTDFKLIIPGGGDYRARYDSALRGFVSLASVPSLASTPDWRGRARAAAGTTDAGAIQYGPPVDDFRLSTDVGIGN